MCRLLLLVLLLLPTELTATAPLEERRAEFSSGDPAVRADGTPPTGLGIERVDLDSRRALELQSPGGAHAKIQEVDVAAARIESRGEDGGFACVCTWTATGSVGHWGHIHRRSNRYEAKFTLEPMDNTWKITGIELVDEERL